MRAATAADRTVVCSSFLLNWHLASSAEAASDWTSAAATAGDQSREASVPDRERRRFSGDSLKLIAILPRGLVLILVVLVNFLCRCLGHIAENRSIWCSIKVCAWRPDTFQVPNTDL